MSRRLLILACSATKTDDDGYIPALRRYNGPLWQTLRTVDPNGTKARVAFVSARYGFAQATDPIQNYNEKMTTQRAAEMIAGGLRMKWPKPTSRRAPPGGISAWPGIAHLSRNGERPFSDVAIVGGSLYLDVMRNFVELFRQSHWDGFESTLPWVKADARLVEINGPIGLMRQSLRAWLNDHSEPSFSLNNNLAAQPLTRQESYS